MNSDIKNITIIGDSLAMIRPWEKIYLSGIYSTLLSKELGCSFFITNMAKRENTIKKEYNALKHHVLYNDPSYVVIQLGIVDCAPRIFSKKERIVVNLIHPIFLRKRIIRLFSNNRYFLTKHFKKYYTNKIDFEKYYNLLIEKILQINTVKKIIIINICDTNVKNKERSYDFNNQILKYNEIIKQIWYKNKSKIELIDAYKATRNNVGLLLEDGIHISGIYHKILAKEILRIINNNEE